MKYSLFALLFTAIELAAIALSAPQKTTSVLYAAFVYGSPIYLVRTVLSSHSFSVLHPLYLSMILYHVIKYFCLARATANDEPNLWRIFAVMAEIGYLGYCGVQLF